RRIDSTACSIRMYSVSFRRKNSSFVLGTAQIWPKRQLREGPPMLRRTYLPCHDQNLMQHEGDTVRARRAYFDGGSPNLRQLLRQRYEWMNRFIDQEDVGVDLGCGTGLSKEFIRAKTFQLSDVADYDWLDFKHVDALATPFDNESFDFVICSNMIHHVAHP